MQYNINANESVNNMLKVASQSANELNGGEIATEYLLYGIIRLNSSKAQSFLSDFGVLDTEFLEVLKESKADSVSASADLTPKSKQVFVMAQNLATELKSPSVDALHLLFCVLMNSDCVAVSILDKVFNVNIIDLKNKILEQIQKEAKEYENLQQNAQKQQKNAEKHAQNAEKSKNIEKRPENKNIPDELLDLGVDLTEKARLGKIDKCLICYRLQNVLHLSRKFR